MPLYEVTETSKGTCVSVGINQSVSSETFKFMAQFDTWPFFPVDPPLLKLILRCVAGFQYFRGCMTTQAPYKVPVTWRDILLLFFWNSLAYMEWYTEGTPWKSQLESPLIDMNTLLLYPMTGRYDPLFSPDQHARHYASAQPLCSCNLHERRHQPYAVFATNVFGFWILSIFHGHFRSPSFPSFPRKLRDFPLFHVSQSLKSRHSAKCTNAANWSCSNSVIFRKK
jgi:hypothetical protein